MPCIACGPHRPASAIQPASLPSSPGSHSPVLRNPRNCDPGMCIVIYWSYYTWGFIVIQQYMPTLVLYTNIRTRHTYKPPNLLSWTVLPRRISADPPLLSARLQGSIGKDAVRFVAFDSIRSLFSDPETHRSSTAQSIASGSMHHLPTLPRAPTVSALLPSHRPDSASSFQGYASLTLSQSHPSIHPPLSTLLSY